jgi:16S rRNA (guanine527-N7)-methyltransferase
MYSSVTLPSLFLNYPGRAFFNHSRWKLSALFGIRTMTLKIELQRHLEAAYPERSGAILTMCERYGEWLLEKNRVINLISRKTDPDTVWTLHFLDSILSAGCVDYRSKRIIDIGTGGGFPGVPLAILYPDAQVTLLDSTRKKILAIQEGVEKTGLTNCAYLDVRLEEVPRKYHGTFDIAVCRSVRILPEYKRHLLALLKNDGCIVLYKSRDLDDTKIFTGFTVTDVSSPLIGERKIIIIPKSRQC